MNSNDLIKWQDKNERLNKDVELTLGVQLKDSAGHCGVVVRLEPPTESFQGCIYVWQSDRIGYGDDNCEHYTYHYWKRNLRIIE
jgi:hypothetical protein